MAADDEIDFGEALGQFSIFSKGQMSHRNDRIDGFALEDRDVHAGGFGRRYDPNLLQGLAADPFAHQTQADEADL